MLEFRILGPVEVVDERGPLRLGGPKQRAVLTILLLDANRVVPIDRLGEDLYGAAKPASAVTQIHGHVSQLRKLLDEGRDGALLETRAPGYLIRVAAEQFDLHRFEALTRSAADASGRGEHETAAVQLADALALWRGPALADLAEEPFVRPVAARLDDLRLSALEQQIDAWLALGREADAIATLAGLIAAHPFRERIRAQHMLALYRSGRQPDALEAYRAARDALVEQFGLEPTPALQRLHQSILTQDAALARSPSLAPAAAVPTPRHTTLVAPREAANLDALLRIAEPLATLPGREVVVAHLLDDPGELARASAALAERRAEKAAPIRAAVFTSSDPVADVVRLATDQNAELVVVDAPCGLAELPAIPESLAQLFARSPADVAAVTGTVELEPGAGVVVPFGGAEHDWAALELGGLLTTASDLRLRLVGTTADPASGRRDASRMLAGASLAVERVLGVGVEPLLAEPTVQGLSAAVGDAAIVVVGVPSRWRQEGLGSLRRALVGAAHPPVVVVHRGLRPSGLAPVESATRFSWTLSPA